MAVRAAPNEWKAEAVESPWFSTHFIAMMTHITASIASDKSNGLLQYVRENNENFSGKKK